MIENINIRGVLYAILIKANYSKEGIEFFTPESFSQQLAYMKRPKNYEIIPHIHVKSLKQTFDTQEVLLIKSGKVRIDFYENEEKYLISRILLPGDVILLSEGGHGFFFIEESEIIEVKQGPYDSSKDKVRFRSINNKINFK